MLKREPSTKCPFLSSLCQHDGMIVCTRIANPCIHWFLNQFNQANFFNCY